MIGDDRIVGHGTCVGLDEDNRERMLKAMYPINEQVHEALARFPAIAKAALIPATGRSTLEIVRLLGNTHYPNVEETLQGIDRLLPVAGPIGNSLLKQTDGFQFNDRLAELFLLGDLRARFGDDAQPVVAPKAVAAPDLEVRWRDVVVKVEVYSPVELIGFQLFESYLVRAIKYLDVPVGFAMRVSLRVLDESTASVWYPSLIPGHDEALAWVRDATREVSSWLAGVGRSAGDRRTLHGPATMTEVDLEIMRLTEDPDERLIVYMGATRSTDARLIFEVETAEYTAKSGWGRKLRHKLRRAQAGSSSPQVLRILCINFAHADAGDPQFFRRAAIAERIGQTVPLLVEDIVSQAPYDAVLPALLSLRSSYGTALWLDQDKASVGDEFLREANLG